MDRRRLIGALAVASMTFVLYRATLLPGVDFGDTGSLQTTVGSGVITPREGYPLYFAIGNVFTRIAGGDHAHALNLVSAVEASAACATLVLTGAELSGSLAAGIAAALFFASSYTFWSQAIIAEVYALHMFFVGLALLLLLRWAEAPTTRRLTSFFLIYAVGFGNHLSMVLLAPAFTFFLLASAPNGWRSMLTPRVVTIALVCACAGALQYAWNFRALSMLPMPPTNLTEAFQRFWFDVTKVDWRDSMVMHVPRSMFADRASMYAFDLEQQFGWTGALVALAGVVGLLVSNWRRAALMLLLYLANVAFAFSYNVGDAHVFYLPSHLIIALLAAPGIVAIGQIIRQRKIATAALAIYAGARMYGDYPALDRSDDHRPGNLLAATTSGLDDRHAILVSGLNWQVQNGLSYFAQEIRPEIAWTPLQKVSPYAPRLIADNLEVGREVIVLDPRAAAPSIAAAAGSLERGTRYALVVLKPTRDETLDWNDLGRAFAALAGGSSVQVPGGDYIAVAGMAGQPPSLIAGANRPFRRRIDLDGVVVDIRMESWVNADTIRRMGFGHVIVSRRHTLIVERGVSFVGFDGAGRPLRATYASNIFAPKLPYLIQSPR